MQVATGWNSTFHMMAHLVEQKDAVSLVLASTDSVSNLTLYKWRTAADYCKTLQPCEEATSLMSGSRHSTLSMIIPVLNILHKKVRDVSDGLTDLKGHWLKDWTTDGLSVRSASVYCCHHCWFALSSEDTFRTAFTDVPQKWKQSSPNSCVLCKCNRSLCTTVAIHISTRSKVPTMSYKLSPSSMMKDFYCSWYFLLTAWQTKELLSQESLLNMYKTTVDKLKAVLSKKMQSHSQQMDGHPWQLRGTSSSDCSLYRQWVLFVFAGMSASYHWTSSNRAPALHPWVASARQSASCCHW